MNERLDLVDLEVAQHQWPIPRRIKLRHPPTLKGTAKNWRLCDWPIFGAFAGSMIRFLSPPAKKLVIFNLALYAAVSTLPLLPDDLILRIYLATFTCWTSVIETPFPNLHAYSHLIQQIKQFGPPSHFGNWQNESYNLQYRRYFDSSFGHSNGNWIIESEKIAFAPPIASGVKPSDTSTTDSDSTLIFFSSELKRIAFNNEWMVIQDSQDFWDDVLIAEQMSQHGFLTFVHGEFPSFVSEHTQLIPVYGKIIAGGEWIDIIPFVSNWQQRDFVQALLKILIEKFPTT